MQKGILLLFGTTLLTSCGTLGTNDKPNVDPSPPGEETNPSLFTDADFLQANGSELKKNHGDGDAVVLKGINAGGYLVIEQWMTAIQGSEKTGHIDHKRATEIFVDRFGKEKTLELWDYYRTNYWTDLDFDNVKDMGMNVIRLPFSYMNLDPEYNNVKKIEGQKYNFSLLDDFVEKAAERGIYTILDMHGAYGSQNGQDHSGEIFATASEVDFYTNAEKKSKTIDLWTAIAEHFKGNPAVAGYDILNEPGEKAASTTEKHWKVFDEIYDAIRTVDEDHVVIFESCWEATNLPSPSEYGWENCMYEFHHYTGASNASTHYESMQNKINSVEKMNFNVPLYMGEFSCYNSAPNWEKTLALFNAHKWSYTPWTYKVNRNSSTSKYPGWGVYYTNVDKIVPDEDSVDTIEDRWYQIDTAYETSEKMKFENGSTLELILKKYCTEN